MNPEIKAMLEKLGVDVKTYSEAVAAARKEFDTIAEAQKKFDTAFDEYKATGEQDREKLLKEFESLKAAVDEVVKKANERGMAGVDGGEKKVKFVNGIFTTEYGKQFKDIRSFMKLVKAKAAIDTKAYISTAKDDGVGGGYLVPEDMAQQIIDLVNETGSLIPRFWNYPMARGTRLIPKLLADPIVGVVDEAGLKPVGTPMFGQLKQTAKDVAVIIGCTDEELEDSAFNLSNLIQMSARRAFSKAYGIYAITGGSGFTGLINADGIRTAVVSTTSLSILDFMKVKYAVPERFRANGVFLMNTNTYLKYYSISINGIPAGYFFQNKIDGSEVIINDELADGQIIFGDLSYVIFSPVGNQIKVKVSQDAIVEWTPGGETEPEKLNAFQQDATLFRFNQRVEITPIGEVFAKGTVFMG